MNSPIRPLRKGAESPRLIIVPTEGPQEDFNYQLAELQASATLDLLNAMKEEPEAVHPPGSLFEDSKFRILLTYHNLPI